MIEHVPHNLSVMQSSQLDTASPDQDGSRSQTARNTTNILHPTKVYDCLSYRCKFSTVEQLQLSVLKRGKKYQRLQTRSIAFAQWKKRLEHFLRTEEETYFLINGQQITCVIQRYNKIIYLKLHKIVGHFCATL